MLINPALGFANLPGHVLSYIQLHHVPISLAVLFSKISRIVVPNITSFDVAPYLRELISIYEGLDPDLSGVEFPTSIHRAAGFDTCV